MTRYARVCPRRRPRTRHVTRAEDPFIEGEHPQVEDIEGGRNLPVLEFWGI
ncbi:hypothetical protein [Actinoplanes sp. NPDC026623]|uniref:hypothetical protein n=1 Tax=Actinoplanes sp. NPDC026623 TaxID=3155610 RepID=UPI0033C171E2